jgi:hypothetical protein
MRIYKLLLGGVLGITLCLLFLTGVLYADGPVKLEIIPYDEELNLVGAIGADTRFEDGFRLVARGGDLASITFDPSDLTDVTDDDNKIPFWKITVETTKPLSEDIEETFKLVVAGWDKPGTYSGQLRILKPGEPSTQGLIIPVTLTAEATPEVEKVPTTAKLDPSLAHCEPGLECQLTQLLVGQASTQRTVEIRLKNKSLVSAVLQDPEVTDVKGQTAPYQLTAKDFDFDLVDLYDGTLPSKKSGVLKVEVKVNQIPPDEYKGTITIPVQDQDTSVSIDVDLKVRGRLFVPIILIVIGWLAGRGIKLFTDAKPRLLRQWASNLEKEISKIDNEDKKKDFLKDLATIKQKIDGGKLGEAESELRELRRRVEKALALQAKGLGLDESLTDEEQHKLDQRLARKERLQRSLGWLSGITPEFDAPLWLGIGRTLGYLALLLWITFLGLQQKYIGQATFGANALPDYMGVITWAMSADIVGRTIGSIGQSQ